MIESLKDRLEFLSEEIGEINCFYAEEYLEELEVFSKKIKSENDKNVLWDIFDVLDEVRKEVLGACEYCYQYSYEEEERKALDLFLDIERAFLNLEETCKKKIYA